MAEKIGFQIRGREGKMGGVPKVNVYLGDNIGGDNLSNIF